MVTNIFKVLLPAVACFVAATPAAAAPINYGDFAGPTVTYLQVTEDSATDPTPLWGAPTLAGDGITFSPPASFAASASNGSSDITDGKLNTTLITNNVNVGSIHNILINERGDYTLAGTGTTATNASVAAPVFLTLTEVNGSPISPVSLYSGNVNFAPSGGTFDLVNDPGIGIIWNGALLIDVDAQMASLGISGRATRIQYVMDNTLLAFSQSGTISFIEKKDGFIKIQTNVPEPSTLALALLGSLALVWRYRRRAG